MDISIVIVSYNVAELLKNCLESIYKFTDGVKFEVIVADNKSSDNSVEIIKGFSKVKFIDAGENVGFAKGNNLGIKEATGKYIFLLNPDTLFLENTPKLMFDWMENHNFYAVVSGQMLDSEQKVLPTGGYFPTLPKIAAWAFFVDDFFKMKSYHVKSNDGDPDWVTGAFFVVRREAMEKVGLFDENFFMYGEELEWCLRFKQAGWQVGYTPITKIIHLERKSSGGLPRNAVLGEFKGLKYIYAKHFSGWRQTVLESLLDIAAFLRIIFWLVRLKSEMAKIYLEALFI